MIERIYPLKIYWPRKIDIGDGKKELMNEVLNFSIRTLTVNQYQQLIRISKDLFDLDDNIIETCVVSAPDYFGPDYWSWDEVPAGIEIILCRKIRSLSGFADDIDPVTLAEVSSYTESPRFRTDLLILTAFDTYTLENLGDTQIANYMKLIELAKAKLFTLGFPPEAILDPEGYSQKLKPKTDPRTAVETYSTGKKGRSVEVENISYKTGR